MEKQTIVTVTTSMPLSGDLKKDVESFVLEKAGKNSKIEYVTDNGIIGGIVIEFDDVIYDGSVKRHTDAFKQKF